MDQDRESPEDELIPDEPRAVENTGTTASEQREGASLDERLAEEEPDREPGSRPRSGRLVEQGSGLRDHEKDEVAEQAEEDTGEPTEEESAIRIDEEPGGATGGPNRYVEEDERPA